MTKTTTDPGPEGIAFTLEDVAFLSDGTDDLPNDMALRLRALFLCDDLKPVAATFRVIGGRLEELRRMAEDAGVEQLADGLYVYRCLERLRSLPWERPADVLDLRLEVPFQELLSMTRALAARAEAAEQADLEQLCQRLTVAAGEQIGDDDMFKVLIERLISAGPEAAEEALRQLMERYRQRLDAAAEKH